MHDTSEEDSRLMRAAQGNPALFEPIYARYVERIYGYCLRRVGDRLEAEDLTSQVFTRALITRASFRGGMVSAWLFQIAANAITDHLRQRRLHVSLDLFDIAQDAEPPIDVLVQDEDLTRVRRLLEGLPADQRELLDLKLGGGLNSEEIGRVVGKSAVAVRSSLHRMLRRLYQLYLQTEKEVRK